MVAQNLFRAIKFMTPKRRIVFYGSWKGNAKTDRNKTKDCKMFYPTLVSVFPWYVRISVVITCKCEKQS